MNSGKRYKRTVCMTISSPEFDGDSHESSAHWFGMTVLFGPLRFPLQIPNLSNCCVQTITQILFYVNFVNLHSSTGTVEIFMLTEKNADYFRTFSYRPVEKPVDSVENLCGKLVIFCYTLRLCKQFAPFPHPAAAIPRLR